MDDEQLTLIHRSWDEKIGIVASGLIYNGKAFDLEEIKLHGQTTLEYRRKSYTVSINKKMSFRTKEEFYKFKDFYLISLSMDKNHFRNTMSFQLLKELGIFELANDYVNLIINDQNEGIFLLVQRPQDWALKRMSSPYILRRDYGQKIDKEKYSKELSEESILGYQNQFRMLYEYPKTYKGKALYKKMNSILDLEEYYRWLAFNFLVKNGDYCDELYLFIDPETNQYRPIPWDYDDIFSPAPHEGNVKRLRTPRSDFIFSIQEPLDQYLISDDYCYERYKETLYSVLKSISPGMISQVLKNIYVKLYPYYVVDDIIEQTRYDKYGKTSLYELEEEMAIRYEFMVNRREQLLEDLEQQLSKKYLAKNK